jgi:hypothetical protein
MSDDLEAMTPDYSPAELSLLALREHLEELAGLDAGGRAALDMASPEFREHLEAASRCEPDLDEGSARADMQRYAALVLDLDMAARKRGGRGLGSDADAAQFRRTLSVWHVPCPLRRGSPAEVLRSELACLDVGWLDRGSYIDSVLALLRSDPQLARRFVSAKRGLPQPESPALPSDAMPLSAVVPRLAVMDVLSAVGDRAAAGEVKKLWNRLVSELLRCAAARRLEDMELDDLGLERAPDVTIPDIIGRMGATAQGLLAEAFQAACDLGVPKLRQLMERTAEYPT